MLNLLPLKLKPSEVDQLIEFYTDPGSRAVYYLAFDKDLEDFGNQPVEAAKPAEPSPEEEEQPETQPVVQLEPRPEVKPILRKIKQFSFQTHAHPVEFFKSFDRFHNGTVPIGRMSSVLTSLGIGLSKAEIDEIIRNFTDARRPEFANYMNLCSAADNISPDDVNGFGAVPLSDAENTRAEQIVRRWSETLCNKRWTFRRLLAGLAEPLVTVEVFRAKLISTGLLIKSDEWNLILRKYRGSPDGDIDWKRFVEDTEKRIPLV
jgi:Ca2+-binding EF-hand superfamily protein